MTLSAITLGKDMSDNRHNTPRRALGGLGNQIGLLATIIATGVTVISTGATLAILPRSDEMWKIYFPGGGVGLLALGALAWLISRARPSQTATRRREKRLRSLAIAIKERRTTTPRPKPNIPESNYFFRDLKSDLREIGLYPIQPEVETDAYAYNWDKLGSMTRNAEFVGCRVFVGKLADELEMAGELGETATTAAALRECTRDSYRSSVWRDPSEAMVQLRRDVVKAIARLGKRNRDRELALLVEEETETLARTMGEWLHELLKELLQEVGYPYLIVIADQRTGKGAHTTPGTRPPTCWASGFRGTISTGS